MFADGTVPLSLVQSEYLDSMVHTVSRDPLLTPLSRYISSSLQGRKLGSLAGLSVNRDGVVMGQSNAYITCGFAKQKHRLI